MTVKSSGLRSLRKLPSLSRTVTLTRTTSVVVLRVNCGDLCGAAKVVRTNVRNREPVTRFIGASWGGPDSPPFEGGESGQSDSLPHASKSIPHDDLNLSH